MKRLSPQLQNSQRETILGFGLLELLFYYAVAVQALLASGGFGTMATGFCKALIYFCNRLHKNRIYLQQASVVISEACCV